MWLKHSGHNAPQCATGPSCHPWVRVSTESDTCFSSSFAPFQVSPWRQPFALLSSSSRPPPSPEHALSWSTVLLTKRSSQSQVEAVGKPWRIYHGSAMRQGSTGSHLSLLWRSFYYSPGISRCPEKACALFNAEPTRPHPSHLSLSVQPLWEVQLRGAGGKARSLLVLLLRTASTFQWLRWFATTTGGDDGRLIWVAFGSSVMPAVAGRRTNGLLDVKQSLRCCGAASVTGPIPAWPAHCHPSPILISTSQDVDGASASPSAEAALEARVGKCLAPTTLGRAWLAGRGTPYPRKTTGPDRLFCAGERLLLSSLRSPHFTMGEVQLCWSWRSPKAPTGADTACSEVPSRKWAGVVE